MKLRSVTFPSDSPAFRVGGDSRNTWHAEQHHCEIWIAGEWVYVQKGDSKALAHVTRVAHAVPLETPAAMKRTKPEPKDPLVQ